MSSAVIEGYEVIDFSLNMSLLVLTAEDVVKASSSLSSNELMTMMGDVFLLVHTGMENALPQRIAISSSAHNTLFMPARIDRLGTAIKVVSVPTQKNGLGLPGSTLVMDEATGAARAIVNAGSLTAVRNAAGSLLATKLVGPSLPKTILMFGAGRQIEEHVKLFLKTYPSITRCTIVNRSRNSRLERLVSSLQNQFPRVQLVSECALEGIGQELFDLADAVRSADIICTATSSTVPLFKAEWVKNGTHLNLIGSYTPQMQEIEGELVQKSSLVLVDSKEACLKEAGELIRLEMTVEEMVSVGQLMELSPSTRETEIQKLKLRKEGGITIFKSVGVGLQDVAITFAVVKKAIDMRLGTQIQNYS